MKSKHSFNRKMKSKHSFNRKVKSKHSFNRKVKSKHSLISPSNFVRRMICAGSLHAEKDLPDQPSKYATDGTMLHKRTYVCHDYLDLLHSNKLKPNSAKKLKWSYGLSQEYENAVLTAANYFHELKHQKNDLKVIGCFHEMKCNLSFIDLGMKGTADSVLLLIDEKVKNIEVHVIDYKFGKGVRVTADKNFQLILYYLGVVNDEKIKKLLTDNTHTIHLHIVQPFIKNSRWDLSEAEHQYYSDLYIYKKVVEKCYDPNAERVPDKKACEYCKAKATCLPLSNLTPKLDINICDLEDDKIAVFFDNRELIKKYLVSIEQYIRNKIETVGFDGYVILPKISNRKWSINAPDELYKILGDKAYEITKKTITITEAEKLLDKEILDQLTIKEVSGNEIIKIK